MLETVPGPGPSLATYRKGVLMPAPLVAGLEKVSDRREGELGATAVEYALMVALIALVIFGAVTALGISLNDLFDNAGLRNALTI